MGNLRILILPIAMLTVLTACGQSDDAAPVESDLPAVNRFQPSDLDSSKNPCTDFDGYVNRKWLAANAIPADRTSWGTIEMLSERTSAIQRQLAEKAAASANAVGVEKIIGDFWLTGMDEARANAQGIQPMMPTLRAIDGLQSRDALVDYLHQTAAKGQGVLFEFGVDSDFNQPDVNLAYVYQGGLGLPDTTYYFDADKQSLRDAYVKHIATVLELSGIAAADSPRQASEIMAFETRLAKVSKSAEEMSRDVSLEYNPLTLTEADKLTPNFSWTKFFESQGVSSLQKFSLSNPGFHQEVSAMLGDTDLAAWRAYLRFHTVDTASPYLSEAFVNAHFNFHNKTLRGQKEIKPRWKRVLSTIEDQSGEAMGQLYVKAAFSQEAKAKMETLVANLGKALKARIQALAWMSDETKIKALEKLAAFTAKIGYPDKWRDWSGLSTGRDSYIANVLSAKEFNYKWALGQIGKPVDKTKWDMSPQTVNAYYHPLRNELVFPAAILQPPFFDPDATDEMNYGGIGAVIAHEMTHGFDDQGSRFGATGRFENWWRDADAERFKLLTGKLVAQFDAYSTSDGQKINGKLTLGENIADLGGLTTAYDAMKKATEGRADPKTDGLTRDQRFFLNWATVWRENFTPEVLKTLIATDPHAPAQFRAIGAPSNMSAFATAFSCRPGDTMVRTGDQQVVIW